MKYDVVVIGGGIVGLATAYQTLLSKEGARVAVIEKEDRVAKHQTGNNSGVIHSGIYYKPGSLKAKNCINGYNLLLQFCAQHDIPHELCGKVIVATDEKELPMLQNIYDRGIENGLLNLRLIEKEELHEIEPHCAGIKAIRVPQTGIVDYVAVCEKLVELIREKGGEMHLGEKVRKMEETPGGELVHTEKQTFSAKVVVNCAGLYSDKVTNMNTQARAKIIPFRGEYYELKPEKRHLVKHLIYPVPDPSFPFLGVHFTRMIQGGVEAGPNAVLAYAREGYTKGTINLPEFFESITYSGFIKVALKYWQTGLGEIYRSYSKSAFTKALQKLIPEIQEDDLQPGGAGVRAQACEPGGGLIDDFKIAETKKVINVINAPSPAATSSLSIGNTVSAMAIERL